MIECYHCYACSETVAEALKHMDTCVAFLRDDAYWLHSETADPEQIGINLNFN